MKNGIMRKSIFISFILLLFFVSYSNSKQNLYLFTNLSNCKSCNNPVLNMINYHSETLDSLEIKYEVYLKCRRSSDLKYFKKYFNLDSNLKITKLNDSIINQYEVENVNSFMIYKRNDSTICESEYLEVIIECISRSVN